MPTPHVLAPTFLEPPQYLAAIPVQPVLTSNFPVGSNVIPAPLPTSDLLNSNLVMTPAQNQMQDQLQRKHEELQHLIVQQQEELRRVSEQLIMARYGLLPAAIVNVSVPFTTNVGLTSTHNVVSDVNHHQHQSHQIMQFEQMGTILQHPTTLSGSNHGDGVSHQNANDIIHYLQLPPSDNSQHQQHQLHPVSMNSGENITNISEHPHNSDLEVMPFQMSQAQAQLLFSSNIESPTSTQRCEF